VLRNRALQIHIYLLYLLTLLVATGQMTYWQCL